MKSIILISILVLTSFYSCNKEKKIDYVIISGKIENSNSDSLSIISYRNKTIHKINLLSDNTFKDTLYIPEGFYLFFNNKTLNSIYLKPSFDINISLKNEDAFQTIIYNGKGSIENNYLVKKDSLKESFGTFNYYGYYAKFDEKNFLKQTDSLYEIKTTLLKNQENLDNNFYFLESQSLKYEKLEKLSRYESMHGFVTKNYDFKISNAYPDPYANIDLFNDKLIILPSYIMFVEEYLKQIDFNEKENTIKDRVTRSLDIIDKNISNPNLKEILTYNVGKYKLKRSKDLEETFNKYNSIAKNEKYKKEVEQIYLSLNKLKKGAISPTFELFDINNKLVSLSDFKGKLIYIDIWATWCGPCKAEIPALKKLENRFKEKNIQFISISYKDNIEKWKKMVEDKNLGGVQLFAPNKNISFFKNYQVSSIPRFILIDKDGRIIDSNAKRPSSPKLKEQLQNLL